MTTGNWHFLGFSRILAFQINWDDPCPSDGILDQDEEKEHRIFRLNEQTKHSEVSTPNLNPSRYPPGGIELNELQIQLLCDAVCLNHAPITMATCFYPHHAFVFLGENDSVIGHIEVCFRCSTYRGEPNGFSTNWDLNSIEELLDEIGLDISNPKW